MARLHAYPKYMADNIELLREAKESGLTAPRIVAERTIAQLERMLAMPIEDAVVPSLVQVARDEDREAIRAVIRDVVLPADAAFLEALRGDYLAATRPENGLWSAPNGEALYRTQILHWTTLELDPQEVHQTGLDQLESIEAERRQISRAAGFGDDTVAYRASLGAEAANQAVSQAHLIARATDDIERAFELAPAMFRRAPVSLCRVIPVEEYKERDAPFAYYFPPSADTTRPGTYYVNTYDLPSRTYSRLAADDLPRGDPRPPLPDLAREREHGAQQLPALRRAVRRRRVRRGLGPVRGAPRRRDGPVPQRGRALRDARRAGLARGAPRRGRRSPRPALDSPAVDRPRCSAGLTETDAVIETDRYICWPAQALTYKVGQREIERLRREIAARDGDAFDLREFHDQLLGHGSLPLATLARELPNWVTAPV